MGMPRVAPAGCSCATNDATAAATATTSSVTAVSAATRERDHARPWRRLHGTTRGRRVTVCGDQCAAPARAEGLDTNGILK